MLSNGTCSLSVISIGNSVPGRGLVSAYEISAVSINLNLSDKGILDVVIVLVIPRNYNILRLAIFVNRSEVKLNAVRNCVVNANSLS